MVGLTKPKQNRRDLPQGPTWRAQPVLRFWPAYSGTVQPGVDVVPAQRLGLGHQFLVCGWAVKHFCRKHRRAAQHLHVQMLLLQQQRLRSRLIRSAVASSQPAFPGRPLPSRRLAVARMTEDVWRLSWIQIKRGLVCRLALRLHLERTEVVARKNNNKKKSDSKIQKQNKQYTLSHLDRPHLEF